MFYDEGATKDVNVWNDAPNYFESNKSLTRYNTQIYIHFWGKYFEFLS
jgi:hypothetical protein